MSRKCRATRHQEFQENQVHQEQDYLARRVARVLQDPWSSWSTRGNNEAPGPTGAPGIIGAPGRNGKPGRNARLVQLEHRDLLGQQAHLETQATQDQQAIQG